MMFGKPMVRLAWFVCVGAVSLVACGGASSSTITDSSGDGGAGGGSGGGSNGGVNPADAGPGGNTTSISCGNTTCAIPAQVCCITRTSAGAQYSCATGTCAAAANSDGGSAGPGGNQGDNNAVSLACSDQANCPTGTTCCATQSDATGTVAACQMGTACQKDGVQLCDPQATAATSGCPMGQVCTNEGIHDLGLPSTFGRCKRN